MAQSPFYPIIYVRGYAMTQGEIDATTADPFCGFNLGSTAFRAVPDRSQPARKFIFESPVVRLGSDFGYSDVFEDGQDILDPEWAVDAEGMDTGNRLPLKSIIVHRYYDQSSSLLGNKEKPSLENFAKELSALIARVRDLVVANPRNKITKEEFKCYLVAHSMGGLVCRAFLQNPLLGSKDSRACVDKFFTYATPHNGIEMLGVNVPGWLGMFDIHTFNRERIADLLGLTDALKSTERVDWVPKGTFPIDRIFCMVGTNRLDYETAKGLSRTFVGHGSDGLVRIENAVVRELLPNGKPGEQCAKAFTYRAHSGVFGIVNSEDAYQNLTRFLFGDVRIDVCLDIDDVFPPEPVAKAESEGKAVDGLIQIEFRAAAKGKLWYLTRRTTEEDSVACILYADLKKHDKEKTSTHLSTVFLANRSRVNMKSPVLTYFMQLAVLVPDFEINRKLWLDQHFEGGALFRDGLRVALTPPKVPGEAWKYTLTWESQPEKPIVGTTTSANVKSGIVEIIVPVMRVAKPGISAKLRLKVSAWNSESENG